MEMKPSLAPQRIAIIGSGISGMTAAHLLARKHEVHLFEADDRLGGHTATKDIEVASGRYAIDTGFIVFNDWTYPSFIRLMDSLGVKSKASEMSFSVKNGRTGLEYNGADFPRLFAQRRNLVRPSFYRMLLEIVRFNREAPLVLDLPTDHPDVDLTLGAFLDRHGYSSVFAENYAMAMGAAIWSASFAQMRDFPLRFFIHFFKNHGMLSVNERPTWRVIEGGSRSYIAPLVASVGLERIHLSSPIASVRRIGGDSPNSVRLEIGGKNPRTEDFDHVIFACHSDTVKKILGDASPAERDVYAALDYQPNSVVLHTDESVLPKTKKTWAAWNFYVPRAERDRVALTYHMNILQRFSSPENFLVSLNIDSAIDPKKILGRWSYDHPKFTVAAVAAQARWAEISRLDRRTHFAGAYWRFGFHEDGVQSGVRVANAFGEDLV
jgi:predicted NAD/FAD-binding protein